MTTDALHQAHTALQAEYDAACAERDAVNAAKAPDASELHTIMARPIRASAAPSREPIPTLSTSAAATPSGYGRFEPTTMARTSSPSSMSVYSPMMMIPTESSSRLRTSPMVPLLVNSTSSLYITWVRP